MYKAVKKSLIMGSILSSIPVVYAQNPYSDMGSAFGEVANVLLAVLYGIAEFLGPLLSMFKGPQGEVLGRALLGIIIAIILYIGLKDVDFIKKQEKGASFAKAIAIIIAIISAIGIPEEVITGLVGGYQIWLFVFAAIITLIFGKGESRIGFAFKGISYFIFGLGTYRIGSALSDGILRMAVMLMSGIFILGFVYYLFYKAVVGKGIGETVGGFGEGVSKVGAGLGGIGEGVGGLAKGLASGAEGVKGLIDTLKSLKKKDDSLNKRLALIAGRDLSKINAVIVALENLKKIITDKGISDATKEDISNSLGNIINKVKEGQDKIKNMTSVYNELKNDFLVYKNLTDAYIKKLGKKKGLDKKVKSLIKRNEINVTNKANELYNEINILFGLEKKIADTLQECIKYIENAEQVEATKKIGDIIQCYHDEENTITDIDNKLKEITNLKDDIIVQLYKL